MGVANSPYIFQQKMNDLFYGFEFICVYIDENLILTKGDWTEYLQKPEVTFNNLKEKRLKWNIEMSFLWKNRNGIFRFLGNTQWRQTRK